jgi:hypothetical protein
MGVPLDEELMQTMDLIYKVIKERGVDHTDAEIRCMVVATNLRGFAQALLITDDVGGGVDLKRAALGLLGTADWLMGDIEPDKEVKE